MEIKGKTIGTGKPLLCVPVMESNKEEIIDELRTLAKSEADIVEWRIDTLWIIRITTQCAKCLRLRQSA